MTTLPHYLKTTSSNAYEDYSFHLKDHGALHPTDKRDPQDSLPIPTPSPASLFLSSTACFLLQARQSYYLSQRSLSTALKKKLD